MSAHCCIKLDLFISIAGVHKYGKVVLFVIISLLAGRCGVPKANSSFRLLEGSDVSDVVG